MRRDRQITLPYQPSETFRGFFGSKLDKACFLLQDISWTFFQVQILRAMAIFYFLFNFGKHFDSGFIPCTF